ncbi:MAG: 50S ribosomal protein L35ae [Candidatus Nanoarchaeia archaeon]|nr:50S ribosomal protein L35ae [Candidatus Nanoarchaeia archaeon]MDD5588052.1 50S ribosomal protein L35ae [Candidatus Nanoarchaeia archaeon]
MEGLILSYRRGKHTQSFTHAIVKVSGVTNKDSAKKLVKKNVVWESPAKKQIKGVVASSHGNTGKLRVIFKKGIPGQAIGTKVKLE